MSVLANSGTTAISIDSGAASYSVSFTYTPLDASGLSSAVATLPDGTSVTANFNAIPDLSAYADTITVAVNNASNVINEQVLSGWNGKNA